MSVPFSTIRQEVARRSSEFLTGTATGGSTTTLLDANGLNYVDDYWDESVLLMTSGANNGLSRRVQTFTGTSGQLALYSALPSSVASGDTYDLYRRFTPTDIKNATNIAINKSWPYFYETVRKVATATQDTLQYAFPTGPDIADKGFIGVEYQIWTNPNATTFPYQQLSPQLYEVNVQYDSTANSNQRTLQLKFNPFTGRLLRFIFGAPLQNVAADTDRVHLDLPELEWLYQQSVAELWRIEAARSADVARKDAMEQVSKFDAEALRVRNDLQFRWPSKPLRRTRFTTVNAQRTI